MRSLTVLYISLAFGFVGTLHADEDTRSCKTSKAREASTELEFTLSRESWHLSPSATSVQFRVNSRVKNCVLPSRSRAPLASTYEVDRDRDLHTGNFAKMCGPKSNLIVEIGENRIAGGAKTLTLYRALSANNNEIIFHDYFYCE